MIEFERFSTHWPSGWEILWLFPSDTKVLWSSLWGWQLLSCWKVSCTVLSCATKSLFGWLSLFSKGVIAMISSLNSRRLLYSDFFNLLARSLSPCVMLMRITSRSEPGATSSTTHVDTSSSAGISESRLHEWGPADSKLNKWFYVFYV